MTTNQTAPVTDEELDQMIWKLERDGGMTPKMLSLMRELREVRRAKGEPVDQVLSSRVGNDTSTIDKALPDGMALYAAQPAPVVPDVISTDDIPYSVGRFRTHRDCYRDGWNACRAAMLQAGNSPATPDGWIPVSERMPDPKSELRVCVYTPNPHEDIRYRFVPASLFKAVCRDATHWNYMSAPKEVE